MEARRSGNVAISLPFPSHVTSHQHTAAELQAAESTHCYEMSPCRGGGDSYMVGESLALVCIYTYT